MRKFIYLAAFATFLSTSQMALALLPPLSFVIRDVFENRKPVAIEAILKHQIELKGEKIEIEERIVRERGQVRVIWRVPGGMQIPASYERAGYVMGNGRGYPSRTSLFMRYLMFDSADDFRDQLISEQFIRRDQLFQYKPGYIPTGDPQTWNLRENYMRHPDIFLQRLPKGIAVSVVGVEDSNNRRAVFFDYPKKGNERVEGILRLEWKEENQVAGWNFDQFSRSGSDGWYPRHASFDVGGVEMINTQILAWRSIKERALNDSRNQWKAMPRATALPSNVEAALKLLLSYR